VTGVKLVELSGAKEGNSRKTKLMSFKQSVRKKHQTCVYVCTHVHVYGAGGRGGDREA